MIVWSSEEEEEQGQVVAAIHDDSPTLSYITHTHTYIVLFVILNESRHFGMQW